MALSNRLAQGQDPPTSLDAGGRRFTPGTSITGITLTVSGVVEGISRADFVAAAGDAKASCPVSRALRDHDHLEASLAS